MSSAGSGLLRALIHSGGVPRDRILLIDAQSADWQSLTLTGERHRFELRVIGPDSATVASRICDGIEDAEFTIPRNIVADIAVADAPLAADDGGCSFSIEALTVEE